QMQQHAMRGRWLRKRRSARCDPSRLIEAILELLHQDLETQFAGAVAGCDHDVLRKTFETVSSLCRERPRGRAAEQRDEIAPFHSITSSVRASSDGGISRPSAFAVLRLITSSYLVGACTGRSAGFSPLRMRSTYPAARRKGSVVSGP